MTAADLHEAAAYVRALKAERAAITTEDVRNRTTPTGPQSIGQQRAVETAVTWRQDAACRGSDPDGWHPRRFDAETEQAAKAICDQCPVRTNCLAEALEQNETRGIWGGLSETERRFLRRNLPRWSRCTICGRRYLQTRTKQRSCGDDCPGRSEKRRTA